MKTFKDCFKETEDATREKQTIFIQFKIPMAVAEYFHMGIDKTNVLEVETEPHVTLFYANDVAGLTQEEITTALKPLLTNPEYTVTLDDYSVFNGVEGGTQDCLKLNVTVPSALMTLQSGIKETLENHGGVVEQDYPEWKPHCTIAYYPLDGIPKTKNKYPRKVDVDEFLINFEYGGTDYSFNAD